MRRRTFCRIGGLAAGSLLIHPLVGRRPVPTPEEATCALQVATGEAFDPAHLIVDAAGLRDRAFDSSVLQSNTTYFWRVAVMQGGLASPWSETASFTTRAVMGTHPFTPSEPAPVRLAVYSRALEPTGDGTHEVRWNTDPRAGDTYLVILQAGSFSQTRRVQLR